MGKYILFDQFHVNIYVPSGLPLAEYDAMQQTLDDVGVQAKLLRAVMRVIRRQATLVKAKARLSR